MFQLVDAFLTLLDFCGQHLDIDALCLEIREHLPVSCCFDLVGPVLATQLLNQILLLGIRPFNLSEPLLGAIVLSTGCFRYFPFFLQALANPFGLSLDFGKSRLRGVYLAFGIREQLFEASGFLVLQSQLATQVLQELAPLLGGTQQVFTAGGRAAGPFDLAGQAVYGVVR